MKLQNGNIKMKMNFDVPNGYFDKLADNVMANIKFEERRRRRRRTFLASAMSAAATVCAILAAGWFARPEAMSPAAAEMDYAQMYSYNIEATMSDYGLMEMLFSQGAADTEAAGEYAEMVNEYYASPVNLDYFL